MPSTNKTEYLGLNMWESSDRPMRNDFNSDNQLIDASVGQHINNSDIHITRDEKSYLSAPYSVLTYVGNDSESRSFTLTDTFTYMVVFAVSKPLTLYSTDESTDKCYSALGYASIGSSAGLALASGCDGFTVSQGLSFDGTISCLNQSGVQYIAVMFK